MKKNTITQRVLNYLDLHKVEYTVYEHPPCRTSEESYHARIAAGAPAAIGAKALLIKAELAQKNNRLFAKPASVKEGKELTEHSSAAYMPVCEEASTGATTHVDAEIELCNKFNVWLMLVIPGYNRFEPKLLKEAMPEIKKNRFAHADEISEHLEGLIPGSIPPFGSVIFPSIDYLLIDTKLFEHEWLGFNVGMLSRSVVLKARSYQNLAQNAIIAPLSIK